MDKQDKDKEPAKDKSPKDEPTVATAPVKKPKRNRRGVKLLLSEDAASVSYEIQHSPHKGEKISNTVRKDMKFNPRQARQLSQNVGRQI